MLPSLQPGLTNSISFVVTRERTARWILPEIPGSETMPEVFASGHMLALMEWCCIGAMTPHLEPGEGSLGTMFELTHEAATPVGMTVTVDCTLETVDGRQLVFQVIARDEVDVIGRGRHGRTVVRWERFNQKLAGKGK
jgi:fluoroacetyl-CoA thioesterase